MFKIQKAMIGFAAIICAAGIGFNTYSGIKTMAHLDKITEDNKKTNEALDSFKKIFDAEINGDVAQEDDVTIANIYEIKSTTHISDAYKTGKTDDLSDKDKETLDMASKVLDEIIKDDMSEYEKELAVYKWMTTKLGYDRGALVVIPTTQEDCDNPYGVLKYHNAVCVGYATTFRLFMQMMNIECMVVHNSERYHSWNLVKLDDEWYHTDIYSDSDTSNFSHFNMNDSLCSQQESWNTGFFPSAEGIKYNYGYQNKKTFDDVYEIPSIIAEMIDNGENTCSFIAPKDKYDDHTRAVADTILSNISDRVGSDEMTGYTYINYSWIPKGDDEYFLSVSVSVESNGDDFSELITEEDLEKIEEAVGEFFSNDNNFDDGDYDDADSDDADSNDDDSDNAEPSSFGKKEDNRERQV